MALNTLTLNADTHSDIDDIVQRHPTITNFFLLPGSYHLTRQLEIDREDIVFCGLGDASQVHIYQDTADSNAIVIRSSRVSVHHLSIHCENGTGIALTHADVDRCQTEHCHIYGSESYFAVYIAGPSVAVGADTFAAFDSNALSAGNVFDNNIVYCKWGGDAVSFSLQRDGSVRNNIVRGGKIAAYMTRNCVVSNNRVLDSQSHGIICSLPSTDVMIANNYVVRSVASAIAVKPQNEHGEYTGTGDANICICGNRIAACQYIGVEIENANTTVVEKNDVRHCTEQAIYVLRSVNVDVRENRLVGFDRGILFDVETEQCSADNNILYSIFPNVSKHGVMLESTARNNIVTNNTLRGPFLSEPIKDVNTTTEPLNAVDAVSNNVDDYINYHEETLLWVAQ